MYPHYLTIAKITHKKVSLLKKIYFTYSIYLVNKLIYFLEIIIYLIFYILL